MNIMKQSTQKELNLVLTFSKSCMELIIAKHILKECHCLHTLALLKADSLDYGVLSSTLNGLQNGFLFQFKFGHWQTKEFIFISIHIYLDTNTTSCSMTKIPLMAIMSQFYHNWTNQLDIQPCLSHVIMFVNWKPQTFKKTLKLLIMHYVEITLLDVKYLL